MASPETLQEFQASSRTRTLAGIGCAAPAGPTASSARVAPSAGVRGVSTRRLDQRRSLTRPHGPCVVAFAASENHAGGAICVPLRRSR